MPESEVGGTHYRVLFLSALVLLTFTFIMNTLAELVRQRLRVKYASL
jgi:phosphate transport system permease protein